MNETWKKYLFIIFTFPCTWIFRVIGRMDCSPCAPVRGTQQAIIIVSLLLSNLLQLRAMVNYFHSANESRKIVSTFYVSNGLAHLSRTADECGSVFLRKVHVLKIGSAEWWMNFRGEESLKTTMFGWMDIRPMHEPEQNMCVRLLH